MIDSNSKEKKTFPYVWKNPLNILDDLPVHGSCSKYLKHLFDPIFCLERPEHNIMIIICL